jgi:hypothetical protein
MDYIYIICIYTYICIYILYTYAYTYTYRHRWASTSILLSASGGQSYSYKVTRLRLRVAAEPKVVRRLISFPNKHRAECTCEPYGRSSYKIYRCHCQGFERNRKIWGGGGATFGVGITAPFVASPPAVGSRAPTSLSRGGRDHRIVAASSIPQGICGLQQGCGCRVVASYYCFTHGRGKANKEQGQKKIIVRRGTGWKMLF